MKNFKWMPILKTGTFKDKNGKVVSFSEADLDKIIANTNLQNDPQFVIEHPKYDKLGFGSIASLKRVGNYLFALPKEVNEKFKQAVNSGELPGRSVAVDDTTLELQHIGFLPPQVKPAVAGLGNYSFSSENNSTTYQFILEDETNSFADIETSNYEFAQYEVSQWPFRSIKNIFRNLKNAWIEKHGKEEADQIFNEFDIDETGNPPRIFEKVEPEINGSTSLTTSFSQNQNGDTMKIDLSKLDPQLKAAIEQLEAELATTKTELQAATQTISASQFEKNKNEVLAFCESPEMKLKILPAEKDRVVNLLLSVKEKGTLEFSSSDNSKVQFNAFDFLKETLKQIPNKIELSELATSKNADDQNMADYQKTAKAIAVAVK